ncbi:MAG: GYD domain-containing protein [Deltaproteobacteria bacterium]|nr:GYD domain-containing protein [Deltaproteobacteria bacterium]
MPTYIGLYKLTDRGINWVKDAPVRLKDAIDGAEAMGGKVIVAYAVMGEYDYVSVGEFPSDEAAMTYSMALGSQGNVRVTTLRAFTEEEFAGMVSKLP